MGFDVAKAFVDLVVIIVHLLFVSFPIQLIYLEGTLKATLHFEMCLRNNFIVSSVSSGRWRLSVEIIV